MARRPVCTRWSRSAPSSSRRPSTRPSMASCDRSARRGSPRRSRSAASPARSARPSTTRATSWPGSPTGSPRTAGGARSSSPTTTASTGALLTSLSRAQCEAFDDPRDVMARFADWIAAHGGRRPIFISDNNGFDWSFINYYFHRFLAKNPFGHSSQNLGSLYKGVVKDAFANFKHLRVTAHTHHPVDDARGNAEVLRAVAEELGLKISLD